MPRGKIMRDTNAGPGIVYINGEQKSFTLETHWKSSVPPKVGAVVEVNLDDSGSVRTVTVIDEAELAKEQAQKAVDAASVYAKKYSALVLARVGAPTLAGVVLLAVAWIFLATITVKISGIYSESATFYDILKIINLGNGLDGIGSVKHSSAGLYGFIMFAALLAPIAPHFHPNRYLTLGYCVPLAFMLAVGLGTYFEIKKQMSTAQDAMGVTFGTKAGKAMADMASEMMSMVLKSISMGLGFYLAIAVATALAAIGVKKYLASTYSV